MSVDYLKDLYDFLTCYTAVHIAHNIINITYNSLDISPRSYVMLPRSSKK